MLALIGLRAAFASIVILFSSAACSMGGARWDDSDVDATTLEPPMRGFQLKTQPVYVEPGTEVTICEVIELPGEPGERIFSDRLELAVTGRSHRVEVSRVAASSLTAAGLIVGEKRLCPSGADELALDREVIVETPRGHRDEEFPARIGRIFEGGQKLIIASHFYNRHKPTFEGQVALNVHTVSEEDVEIEARKDSFDNLTISIGPGQVRTFHGECRFDSDVLVHELTRRTNRFGTEFTVYYVGGDRHRKLAFSSLSSSDNRHVYELPVRMRSGEGFRFSCTYENTGTTALGIGDSVDDESCILDLTWWPTRPGVIVGDQSCRLTSIDPDGIARP